MRAGDGDGEFEGAMTTDKTIPDGRHLTAQEWMAERAEQRRRGDLLDGLRRKLDALDFRAQLLEALDQAEAGSLMTIPAAEDAERAMRESYGRRCMDAYIRTR